MPERLINLIANVDLKKGDGEILYVTPLGGETALAPTPQSLIESVAVDVANLAAAGGAPVGKPEFEIIVKDAGGKELARYWPDIKQSPCDFAPPGAEKHDDASALIDEVIPYSEGMQSVTLMHGETEVAKFESGPPLIAAGMGPPTILSEALGDSINRRTLGADVEPQVGVTFTVQVQPEGAGPWQTIAVGAPTPSVQVDRNQFPGVSKARVRVLRSTGFTDEVFAEQDLDLTF